MAIWLCWPTRMRIRAPPRAGGSELHDAAAVNDERQSHDGAAPAHRPQLALRATKGEPRPCSHLAGLHRDRKMHARVLVHPSLAQRHIHACNNIALISPGRTEQRRAHLLALTHTRASDLCPLGGVNARERAHQR
eukprot:639300-Pleurochrysis_carterae.AAC.2